MASGAKSTNRDTGARPDDPDLTADIRQLRDDIATLTEHLKETGNRSVSRARQAARESADQLRGSAEEWQHEMAETVREKPLTALALAAAAGWLLAMITRR